MIERKSLCFTIEEVKKLANEIFESENVGVYLDEGYVSFCDETCGDYFECETFINCVGKKYGISLMENCGPIYQNFLNISDGDEIVLFCE